MCSPPIALSGDLKLEVVSYVEFKDEVYNVEIVVNPNASGSYAYEPPSPDFSRPGRFTTRIGPKYFVTCLTLHEGNPGHHLHDTFTLQQPNLPKFIRHQGPFK